MVSMRKLLFFALLLIGVGALFTWRNSSETTAVNPEPDNGSSFRPDPSSATFNFGEEVVTLSKGENVELGTETDLLQVTGYGDLNNDNKEDAVVLMARSGGGSGVFIYIAAYVSGPVSYKGTNAIYVGDRVSPQSISVQGGIATLTYLDREADEPFAAEPTVSTSKRFSYTNGEFVER